MAINTILKGELRGVLVALQVAATNRAKPTIDPFTEGFCAGLEAVAVAYGVEPLPDPLTRFTIEQD